MPRIIGKNLKKKCSTLYVPKDKCYLLFSSKKTRTMHTVDEIGGHPIYNCRGDMVLFDLDCKGRILGIELLGKGKQCQE